MKLRRVGLQNVRSFSNHQSWELDGALNIVIGPNGGGKTNLLDAVAVMLRRFIFRPSYPTPNNRGEQFGHWQFGRDNSMDSIILERFDPPIDLPQMIEVELEVTESDIQNMNRMRKFSQALTNKQREKYTGISFNVAQMWNVEEVLPGTTLRYRLENMQQFISDPFGPGQIFLQYLSTFEQYNIVLELEEDAPLAAPMIYLPASRANFDLPSEVSTFDFNVYELTKNTGASTSRGSSGSLGQLAVGRIASKYRDLLSNGVEVAKEYLKTDPNLIKLTNALSDLGYKWELVEKSRQKNIYGIVLFKQGKRFSTAYASSGERQMLTYLFAIYALNIQDALILIDEPELHLHPSWQKTLVKTFLKLAEDTGNQFLIATHSPTFVTSETIKYVSRVSSSDQSSRIQRLDDDELPEMKRLLQIVNSHVNERLFFADTVVLVEGVSDRLLFEKLFYAKTSGDATHGKESDLTRPTVEFIGVDGKNNFDSYRKILKAIAVRCLIVADLDYLREIGSQSVKALLVVNPEKVKKRLRDSGSKDAAFLMASVDRAFSTGDLEGAKEVWNYIKNRSSCLKPDLSDEESRLLQRELEALENEGIYLLRCQELEKLLPEEHRSKKIEMLLEFLSEKDWLAQLKAVPNAEIDQISEFLKSA